MAKERPYFYIFIKYVGTCIFVRQINFAVRYYENKVCMHYNSNLRWDSECEIHAREKIGIAYIYTLVHKTPVIRKSLQSYSFYPPPFFFFLPVEINTRTNFNCSLNKHQPQRKNCKDTFFSYLNQQIVIALLKILWFPQIDKTNSHWYKPFKAHEIWAARCTYCVCRREMIERRVQNTDNQK